MPPAEPPRARRDVPSPGHGRRRAPIGPRVLGGVLVAIGLFLFWEAYRSIGDDELNLQSPRLAPLIVSGMWVLFAVLYLVRQFVPAAEDDRPEETDGGDAADGPGESTVDAPGPGSGDPDAPVDWRTPAMLLVLLVAYVLALDPVGFVISSAVFFLGAARILGSRRIVRDVIVALVLSFGVYLAFTRLLDIFLPSGVLPL